DVPYQERLLGALKGIILAKGGVLSRKEFPPLCDEIQNNFGNKYGEATFDFSFSKEKYHEYFNQSRDVPS
ncbi:hypothetical protein K7432_011630, partial [Basidiobolus ranarum]